MDSISSILRDKGFRFNKQFGQNFITDTNFLEAMADDAGITAEDYVLEIGAGAGTLTRVIAARAKHTVSYEIDYNLKEILTLTTADVADKLEMRFVDFMKITEEELLSFPQGYKVVANLPYYITTPIIMRLLECDNSPASISIMVQKELAERIVAKAGESEYGAITAQVDLVANATVSRIVSRKMFYPIPNVDSAILRIDVDKNKYDCNLLDVKRLIKASFSMRRKTLINNLMSISIPRDVAERAVTDMGHDVRIRGEALTTEQFIKLSEELKKN